MREDYCKSLSFARHSFIDLSDLGQCRLKVKLPMFDTAAQDSDPDCLGREFEACVTALLFVYHILINACIN